MNIISNRQGYGAYILTGIPVYTRQILAMRRGLLDIGMRSHTYLSDLDKQEVDTYCKQVFDILAENIKNVVPDNTPYLEVARANLAAMPTTPAFEYEEPVDRLLGSTVDMLVLEIGGAQKNNLRGVVEGKYRAVITKNHLIGEDLNEKVGQTVRVQLERTNNGQYEAKPVA